MQREGVLLVPADAEVAGEALGGEAHVDALEAVEQAVPVETVEQRCRAIGPATPMSKSIGLVGIGCRIRMTAPIVPKKNGAGRK